MSVTGMLLLQDVAIRIIEGYLRSTGHSDVRPSNGRDALGGRGVDLTYVNQGATRSVKVKPDPYFGLDRMKVADRELAFYRADASAFAFEAVANAATREPGWMFESVADDLYYYFVAIPQPEDEVRALMNEPDEVFFSELAVERDELVILPMRQTREWFELHFEDYTPRPVMLGGASAWYRLVPRTDIERSMPGIVHAGSVFGRIG